MKKSYHSMVDWTALRGEFPVTKKHIYLNHASVSPISWRASLAMQKFIADATQNGAVNEPRWKQSVQKCREAAARLLNADVSEIAFTKNTTHGILIAANGIDWREGDNVITADVEFPANVYPWLNLARFGVETRFVHEQQKRIPLTDIESAIDSRTRALTISHVEFASGFRNDLKTLGEICRARNIFFIVDAIQSLGALPVDVKAFNIDVLAADGHKWIMGPEGAACFFCEKDMQERLVNTNVGWGSVINESDYLSYDFTQKPNAQRFEEGSYNNVGLHGLKAALELLLEIGVENIEQRVLHLTDLLIEKLLEKGYQVVSSLIPKERSGIVCFQSTQYSPAKLCAQLRQENIIVSHRAGAVRVSPHFYNSEDEILKLVETLP